MSYGDYIIMIMSDHGLNFSPILEVAYRYRNPQLLFRWVKITHISLISGQTFTLRTDLTQIYFTKTGICYGLVVISA